MNNLTEWKNWQWQQRHSIHDLDSLINNQQMEFIVDKKTLEKLHKVQQFYPFSVTPYYLSLIKSYNINDPIYNQIIPTSEELTVKSYELDDPISDENPQIGYQSVKGITHRYPDRVLFYPTPLCSVHCRYCFRKRLVGKSAYTLSKNEIEEAIQYVTSNKKIREVIFTGGDPLSLGDDKLFELLNYFSNIPHIKTIRIHTRYPVTNPFRLTENLINTLKKLKTPLWIVTHFNSHVELTPDSCHHLNALIQNGIPVLNQSVLLKGVNDSEERLKRLFTKLIENRIQPYYLHHADLVKGTSHLRVSKNKGMELMKNIRGQIPGYAIPTYIWDRPGGIGKIPLTPNWDD